MEKKKITFDSFVRGILVALVVIGLLALVKRLSSVLLPFFIAWLVAYMVYPLVTFFQYRLKVKNRVASIFCALGSLAGVGIGAFYLLVPPMVEEFMRVKDLLGEYFLQRTAGGNIPSALTDFLHEHVNTEVLTHILQQDNILDAVKSALPGVWSLVAVAFAGCLVLMAALAFLFVRYLRVLRQQMGELARARAASEEASRAKSEFLSNMSHDIRTPMNAIVGMTQIARERQGDPVAVSECLDKIAVSSNHLLGLINDVLDMSRIESGRMELAEEPVSLEDVLEGTAAIVGPQAEARGVSFEVEKDLECRTVRTDGTRLSQVLLNLLSNAVKFTPAGGRVRLSVAQGPSPRGEGRVRTTLTVSDTGIGMSEEFLGKIFDSFEREDSERVRKTEGTGLGMAIVKRIVDGMGGSGGVGGGVRVLDVAEGGRPECGEERAGADCVVARGRGGAGVVDGGTGGREEGNGDVGRECPLCGGGESVALRGRGGHGGGGDAGAV